MNLISRLAVIAVIVAGIGIFVIAGFLLPATIHVERWAIMDATPRDIYPFLNDFRKFNKWSPWAARDPGAKYVYSGPEQGPGAAMRWQSESLGKGRQQIVVSLPDERTVWRLDLGKMGTAETAFTLMLEGAKTRVTWTFNSELPYNPLVRWWGLILPRRIAADYDEGLSRLKQSVEQPPPKPLPRELLQAGERIR